MTLMVIQWTDFDENLYECYIMKTQFFPLNVMLWINFVIFFTLLPSDLNETLTNILMDNSCPCLVQGCDPLHLIHQ